MIIAIDGYSSCGKSTLSKALAKSLDFAYVDSGAMYRAVTLYFLDNGISIDQTSQVKDALQHIHITFENIDGINTCFLNGVNVEDEIRTMRVSGSVSEVATIPLVRIWSVQMQQEMAKGKDIVMDGRDIGTVVFPYAEVKFFVTADKKVRAERRYQELLQKGKKITVDQVLKNLQHRDHIDSTREHSPLRQAEDAIVLDNTNLSKEEQLQLAIQYVKQIKSTL